MKIYSLKCKDYYVLITILLLNFFYLVIRTTRLTDYFAGIIGIPITVRPETFKMRDLTILIFFISGCVACFCIPQKYYRLIAEKAKCEYIFIGLFFMTVVIFQFSKTQWLFVPYLHSDNHSYKWEDGGKMQTTHIPKGDEIAYIMVAKVIKEHPFKNFVHLHELEEYPERIRQRIWSRIRLHPPLYFYYLALFPDEIWMRFANLLLYTALMIFVYLIVKRVSDEKVAIITAVLYWAAPYFFIRTGLQVSNDLFVSLFVAIAICFILGYMRQRQVMLSGFFTALALLSKYTAVFLIPCILTYILLKNKKNRMKKVVLDAIIFLAPIIVLFGSWILILIGTEIGQFQYQYYIKGYVKSTITQPEIVISQKSRTGHTWMTLLFQIPNSLGLGVIFLALVGGHSLIRNVKLRLFRNMELLMLISVMFIFIVGVTFGIPNLRYSMPGLFVIPLLAAFGIQDFFETEKTKTIAVLFAVNFLVAKTFVLLLEYPY